MNVLKSFAFVVGKYTTFVVITYMAIDTWVVNKAKTVVDPVKSEMYRVREVDKSHFDSRLDRMEHKIDKLLERK